MTPKNPTITFGKRTLQYMPPSALKPNPRNPRKHSRTQIRAIARSYSAFGVNTPILVDRNMVIVAGHGRYEAALYLGLNEVPVICLDHQTPAQATGYMLADNKLADRSEFNFELVAVHLKELMDMTVDFDIEDTGFETAEIDLLTQGLDGEPEPEKADEFSLAMGPPISRAGDLWHLGDHRLYCGSACDTASITAVLGDQRAAAIFTDPPFNVKIDGHASGNGAIAHREFAMASGEMSCEEFTAFLTTALGLMQKHSSPGALVYVCMDWRHMTEILGAATAIELFLVNLCVWVKTNGGMGSLYRSQHELVFVFRNGAEPHRNNVQLGRFGRNRTNVWTFPGATSPGRGRGALKLHPTVKPIRMVAEAILDATAPKDVVLDPFMGSGTTILAAERTGRRAYGIELDPLYIDTAIARWQRMTGKMATLSTGETSSELELARGGDDERG